MLRLFCSPTGGLRLLGYYVIFNIPTFWRIPFVSLKAFLIIVIQNYLANGI